jgi:hypothetical protein
VETGSVPNIDCRDEHGGVQRLLLPSGLERDAVWILHWGCGGERGGLGKIGPRGVLVGLWAWYCEKDYGAGAGTTSDKVLWRGSSLSRRSELGHAKHLEDRPSS